MSFVRSLLQRIKALSRRQLAFGTLSAVILFVVLMGVVYAWDYTNSPGFCGTTCHTMPPEYAAWQRSPHARVNCVECHLGRDIITTTFSRKAGDIMHLVRYSSGQYEFPIYAESMLPARESCEKCHWPEKFADDRAVTIKEYSPDEENTEVATYLLLKTGGGTQRQGQGMGIHWHIENKVYFVATDDQKQNIPWIQVVDSAGKTTTYTDVENPLPQDEIDRLPKHLMDCIDCHNRISHTFLSPAQAVDSALSLKQIDASIPYIEKQSVQVLSASYKSFDEADKAIGNLETYYQENYSDYYSTHVKQVKSAVDFLKTTYQELVFPNQDLSWTTHPDNNGHKDWPGCFRCHDGKHFTQDNKQAIRLECNICHTLPEVGTPSGPAPVISMVKAQEPASHLTTTWLAQHRTVFDSTCQQCHDTNNAGGSDNSSFCSNSACHGTEWRFAGLDAVGLAKIFPPPALPKGDPSAPPPAIPHPIGGNPDCQICHSQASNVRPYPSDHVGRKNDVCLACHKPTIPPNPTPSATSGTSASSAGGPPPVPHDTAGRTQCLGCHSNAGSGAPQVPQFHIDAGLKNDQCLSCHKTAGAAQSSNTPSPTQPGPAASGTPAPTKAASGGAPELLPDHVGRTMCLGCHANNIGPKLPDDHTGRTDDTCKMCHKEPK